MGKFTHIPVMLEQCISALEIKPQGTYIDATMGGAGHSREIAKRLDGGFLYCLDKDPDAVAVGRERLSEFKNVQVVQSDFRNLAQALAGVRADGALFDLGVSSFQLDSAERGFSYHSEAPLDMRMSKQGISAADIVNGWDVRRLTDIFREYGECRFAYETAKKIDAARQLQPIQTTTQLAELCLQSVPAKYRRKQKHPAKTVFQALRIAVNDELNAEAEGIRAAFSLLNAGGRLCVMSFHSIEDRVIKQTMRELVGGCTCPPDFPVCVCGKTPDALLITKKPIEANAEELESNSRAHSAKLRVLEKIKDRS